ncbi:Holliday junction branch migration protein RuvA [Phycicoccus sp. SLBN-51]|uniref:Holliday junction branch migration protein RuvA n=1 Tax=Phycicoccus sp. SLBN-51 TaxID=2768447 RepID=UPI001152D72F|nr:Holliday junction branch migration protein RuvA [Phycicoccus sp. SLBN-51]TQJ50750.1 Holliday junction DNA helicase subunit RuvA [Phycicoccus sp. SLBN-51]
MIASVRGSVLHAGLDRVVVEVGGVGMLVHTTPGTAASVRRGQEAALSTTLVVREDSLTLYGFAGDDERDMFEQVQTVSGVGPRLALAMLSVMPPDRIRAAISGSDIAALTKVPGIGKKGAERMVLELRDKIGVPTGVSGAAAPAAPAASLWREQVSEALVGLGWSAKQADDAVTRVADGAEGDGGAPNVSEMLRAALRELGR